LAAPKGAVFLDEPDTLIVTVTPPSRALEEIEEAEAEAAAEAAAEEGEAEGEEAVGEGPADEGEAPSE
jgi:hypothetical protein